MSTIELAGYCSIRNTVAIFGAGSHLAATLSRGGGKVTDAALVAPIEVSLWILEGCPGYAPMGGYSIEHVTGVKLAAMGPQMETERTRAPDINCVADVAPVATTRRS
jgi:hypothetical protein